MINIFLIKYLLFNNSFFLFSEKNKNIKIIMQLQQLTLGDNLFDMEIDETILDDDNNGTISTSTVNSIEDKETLSFFNVKCDGDANASSDDSMIAYYGSSSDSDSDDPPTIFFTSPTTFHTSFYDISNDSSDPPTTFHTSIDDNSNDSSDPPTTFHTSFQDANISKIITKEEDSEQAVTEENNDQTNINCVCDINTEQQKHHNQLR